MLSSRFEAYAFREHTQRHQNRNNPGYSQFSDALVLQDSLAPLLGPPRSSCQSNETVSPPRTHHGLDSGTSAGQSVSWQAPCCQGQPGQNTGRSVSTQLGELKKQRFSHLLLMAV